MKNLFDILIKIEDSTFNKFVEYFYQPVFNNFSSGQSKTTKINALLDYCKRKDLLSELEQLLNQFKFYFENYNDEKFTLMCLLEFEEVYNNFTNSMNKSRKIVELLIYLDENNVPYLNDNYNE